MNLDAALKALLVPSGNDAAVAIAETIGALMEPGTSDPEAVFVNAMNAKAQELGCTDTVYDNPHGLISTPTRAICTARRPTWRKWCSTP